MNYYFTFGTAEYFPYKNGYLVVKASNIKEAVQKYREKHPDIERGIINCSFVYTEDEWNRTGMLEVYHEPFEIIE